MKFSTFILIFFVAHNISGQITTDKRLVSTIAIDKYFKDTLTFNKKWDYPWYIVVDDDGRTMENTLGGALGEADTVHLFHTANCWTNHQGRHNVRYCDATVSNDTISLFFQPELPAYASELSISIYNNFFWCDFSATHPAPTGKPLWTVTTQKLILDKKSYKPGDMIKGYIEIDFIESGIDINEKPFRKKYYYRGHFKTPLLNSK
jgi:hypothetical protein